jgi:hypothetical protein
MTQTNPIIRAAAAAASSPKSTTAPGGDALKPAANASTTADSTTAATKPTSTANPVAANGQPSKKSATKLGRMSALLKRPPLLSGEEKADYDALLTAVSNVVKPDDVVDRMLMSDVVYHEWNLLRLRRVSAGLINATKTEALRIVLTSLTADSFDFDAERLASNFTKGEEDAIKTVAQLLKSAELTFDSVMGQAMELKIDEIERFDRMAIAAQAWRDAALHEIERRHLVLGQNLRRAFNEVEDADYQVIEPPAAGTEAARP